MTATRVTATIARPDDSVRTLDEYLRERLAGWLTSRDGGDVAPIEAADVVLDVAEFAGQDSMVDWPVGTLLLPVRLASDLVAVGPVYRAGSGGPCPTCLHTRWLGLRPEQELSALRSGGATTSTGGSGLIEFVQDMVWMLVQNEIRRLGAAEQPASGAAGTGWVFVVRRDTLRVGRHQLIAESCCRRCAAPIPDERDRAMLRTEPVSKAHPTATRGRDALEYDMPLARFANPVCGMLGDGNVFIEGGSVLAPVTGVCRPWNGVTFNEGISWSGRAGDLLRSERYGLLEGVERYCGSQRTSYSTVHDCLANLGPDAIDPSDCLTYSDETYERYPHLARFTPELPLRWLWGWSFGRERPVLVPEQLVYYLTHRNDEKRVVFDCSNGCATGGSLPEAILYGLLELVERDAFMFTWLARRRLPEVDISTCRDLRTRFMVASLDRHGYDVHVLDARVDLTIPAVIAVGVRRGGGFGTLALSAGASLDPEEAIRSALCELASYAPGLPQRVADEAEKTRPLVADYSLVRTMEDHCLLYGLPEMMDKADFLVGSGSLFSMDELYADWESGRPRTRDLVDDLRHCVEQVRARGLDVIAVDQTSPEARLAGVNAARVIVPGILTMDFGHQLQRSPQTRRLATALRLAGKLDRDLTPADLNPHPHPFP